MYRKWFDCPGVLVHLKSEITDSPRGWMLLLLVGKRSYRLVSGSALLLTGFSQIFFLEHESVGGRDFSWLISSQLGEQKIANVIDSIAKPGWFFRHPVIAHEDVWIHRLIELDPHCQVYARYEGPDVLRFSAHP